MAALKPILITVFLAGIILFLLFIFRSRNNDKITKEEMKTTRQSAVSGSFYPANKNELQEQINALLLSNEKITNDQMIKLLVVPHAGYDYSGAVAAAGFKQIEGQTISQVIILGSSHQAWFNGAVIDESDSWQTPLGEVALDKELAEKLINQENDIIFSSSHHSQEHSLEVELPFLQTVLKNFKIVPILLGNANDQTIEKLADLITQNFDEKTLTVVSTDLSHYPSYDIAQQVDQNTINSIISGDVVNFERTISQQMSIGYPNLDTCVCGEKAVKTGMLIAQKLGQANWQLVKYANSGDSTSPELRGASESRVVGYAAIIWTQKSAKKEHYPGSSQLLLKIARETLETHLKNKKTPEYNIDDPKLNEKLGVFVTLRKNDQLRGCMGDFDPKTPLWQTVQRQAITAATEDPRFSPVGYDELKEIKIEISVLSKPKEIDDWQKIELGKHGVVLRQGSRGGTFLPQVATETGWALEEFLSQLCSQKAGLPPECYKDQKTKLLVYTAEVLGENGD